MYREQCIEVYQVQLLEIHKEINGKTIVLSNYTVSHFFDRISLQTINI